MSYEILIFGASYGSLLATKRLLGGPDVTLICAPAAAELRNNEGTPERRAFRTAEEKGKVLQVGLPTNFKSARFAGDAATKILKDLERDVEAARFDGMELPVKLKVHDSVFVPLAKWAMLISGNYRCVTKDGMRPIKEAVHSDLAASRQVYNWGVKLCVALGAT